jgi:hypothetical protein
MDIQLTCHPVTGDKAEATLGSARSKLDNNRYQLWRRVVGGQQAEVIVETAGDGTDRAIRTLVVLRDSILELEAHVSFQDLGEILEKIQPLR